MWFGLCAQLICRREPLSEKGKGNIAASSPSAINRKHTEPRRQGLYDENLGFNSAATDQVVVVPPLKYPPRNIVASLSYSGISYINPYLESGKHGFQCRSSLKPEKKNITGRSGMRMIHCHERRLHIEHGSQFKKNGIQSESAQSLGKNRNLSKPLACSNRQHSDSYNRGGEFEGNGHDTMASLLGRPPIRERKPLSPSERAWKSVKDDPAVREVNKLHTKQSRTRWGNIERKRWSQRASYKDTTVSQEDCRSGMDRHFA